MSPVSFVKTLFGQVAVDTTPLRASPDYRWLLGAQAISSLGSSITYVVLPWQIYQLTRSSTMVGLIGVAEFVPMLVMVGVGICSLTSGWTSRVHRHGRAVVLASVVSGGGLCVVGSAVIAALLPRFMAYDDRKRIPS